MRSIRSTAAASSSGGATSRATSCRRASLPFPDPRFNDPYETLGDHELISPQLTTTVIHEDISGQNARRLHTWDIGEGTWTFDAVGTSPGDRVEVRFQGTLYRGVE